MRRVVLVHWNAEEAETRAIRLCDAGYEVICHSDPRANPASLRDDPPDAFVIDLARIPSQGRETGAWLRRQKATRDVPLVFIEGDPEKTVRVRALLPDAAFTTWERIAEDLRDAIEHPPAEAVVPGAMDAYADVHLTKKLGIASGSAVLLIHAPSDFYAAIGDLPDQATLLEATQEMADVIVLFETSIEGLRREFSEATARLANGGRLWIAWPKRVSGVASDLSQIIVRSFGLERGFVDYKIASINQTWSGLCFARRSEERGDTEGNQAQSRQTV
jgi:CheY-like chemotaxis protein